MRSKERTAVPSISAELEEVRRRRYFRHPVLLRRHRKTRVVHTD